MRISDWSSDVCSSDLNLARWQKVSQLTVVGPPQGTYCLSTGVTPRGDSCTITVSGAPFTEPDGYYYIGGPRGTLANSMNELLYDQVDIRGTFSRSEERWVWNEWGMMCTL